MECGKRSVGGAKYCSSCGTAVVAPVMAASSSTVRPTPTQDSDASSATRFLEALTQYIDRVLGDRPVAGCGDFVEPNGPELTYSIAMLTGYAVEFSTDPLGVTYEKPMGTIVIDPERILPAVEAMATPLVAVDVWFAEGYGGDPAIRASAPVASLDVPDPLPGPGVGCRTRACSCATARSGLRRQRHLPGVRGHVGGASGLGWATSSIGTLIWPWR